MRKPGVRECAAASILLFSIAPGCKKTKVKGETPVVGGIVFSVHEDSEGLPDTGIASASPSPQGNVYSARGGSSAHAKGTNTVFATADEMGIDDSDDVDGLSLLHMEAASRVIFSVATGSRGLDGTNVRRQSQAGEEPGDVFFSRGIVTATTSTSFAGNTLWLDEVGLGEQPEPEGGSPLDDLNALELNPGEKLPLYFSLGLGARGRSGTAVEAVSTDQMGCTVFRSDLDGTNEVAFSCADLGLGPDDEVDALVVAGQEGAEAVWFSLAGSADVLRSVGNGSNAVLIPAGDLGLEAGDDLDGLTIRTPILQDIWPPPPCPLRKVIWWEPVDGVMLGEAKVVVPDDTGVFVPVGDDPFAVLNAFIPTSDSVTQLYETLGPYSARFSGMDFTGPGFTGPGDVTITTDTQEINLSVEDTGYTVGGFMGPPVFQGPGGGAPGPARIGWGFVLRWNQVLLPPAGGPGVRRPGGGPGGGPTIVTVDPTAGGGVAHPGGAFFMYVGLGATSGFSKVVPFDAIEDGQLELFSPEEEAALEAENPISVFMAVLNMEALMPADDSGRAVPVATMQGVNVDPADLGF